MPFATSSVDARCFIQLAFPIDSRSERNMRNILREVRNYDRNRPGFPGEHWLVAAAGFALCRSAFTRRSSAGRALALVAGTALVYRAASGRDGLARLTRGRVLAERTITQPERLERFENTTSTSQDARGAVAGEFADSPNEAERLQQSGAFGVGAGIGVEVVEETPDDPTANAGREKIVPGLPDFMRGG